MPIPKSSKVYVHHLSDLPAGEHWVILRESAIHVPAQGVWAPGHGYPAHREDYLKYVAYTNKEEFEAELQRDVAASVRFAEVKVKGIHVSGIYKTEISIHSEEKRS